MRAADLLVVGGGVVGLTTALEWKRRRPADRVVVLEKEPAVARHASGRNSGVLHAGLYYPPGSLKATFARDGNARMARYCRERGLPIRRNGKLVVATRPSELAALDRILTRARASGVEVEQVGPEEARELEPRARVEHRAIWSPSTASVDPVVVMESLADDARQIGIDVRLGERFVARRSADGTIITDRASWSAGYVLNAAGGYADRVARAFGRGGGYRIIPFKGRYLRAEVPVQVERHIYPVPDLRYPFLGVHVTVGVEGGVWLGPTATPVLGREQYGAVPAHPREALGMALGLAFLLSRRHNTGLRRLAFYEMKLQSKRVLVGEAGRLARDLPQPGAWRPARPGIRAQLVDTRRWKLEDDFVYEADSESCHVLNAVSPAFTCAFPLAEHLVDRMEGIRAQ